MSDKGEMTFEKDGYCKNCKWSEPRHYFNKDRFLCRYDSPITQLDSKHGIWPIVEPDDWCRNWTVRIFK